ncbi:type VII secretion target [Nucisporomicrobium flavum]|uniref:type VII secretion target n=1 Tax=Nucisporomicrobium flavum TaxID=2785915 RepID=UPI0018F3EC70|nr:type VII secretion target [Nucisporomicrobium flavum]
MADGFSVDVAQLRAHAAKIDAVQRRFGAVKAASAAIAQDDAAYGMLCAWMSTILERRHVRQDELLAYMEENLALAAEALIRTGDDYDAVDGTSADRVRRAGRLT